LNNAVIMKNRKERILISVALVLLLTRYAAADLAQRVNNVIAQPVKQGVKFSILILDPRTGSTVFEYEPKRMLIPASNMKAVTSAAAIHYLGADYQYITKVGIQGKSLVVIGSGDPIFGDRITDDKYKRPKDWIFAQIAESLRQNDITNIDGMIVDSGFFEDRCVHPNWPVAELNKAYACEISGLNFNVNCINLIVRDIDGVIVIDCDPKTSFVTFVNEVEPISSGNSAIATYRNRQPNKLTVTGKCEKMVGPFEVAIERPAAMFGFILYEYLSSQQFVISGQLSEAVIQKYNNFKELTEFKTPLADCLARCNKDSLGLAAEALLKTISAENDPNHKNGSWEKGSTLVAQYLEKLGVDGEQFNLDDGSGLSRKNGLSAYAITRVLLDMYRSDSWQIYRDSLSVGGVDGVLDDFFKEKKYQSKVLAKTGYISGVRSMSGICITDQGEFIFSILANNAYSISRQTINEIAQAVIDEYNQSRPAAN
jgi:serine-type D-Ala-D-Ala carboxypeptidase/endopeptidase (penicillin-binding protein 4)